MTTNNLSNSNNGVFTVGASGKVSVDYLYDGGAYKGELAIFSLRGMENLTPGSSAFIAEATSRALSNSDLGYVVIKDGRDRARLSATLPWESNFNGGVYQDRQNFNMQANDTFAMMLIANGTVANFAAGKVANQPLFSFGSINFPNGQSVAQMVDVTGRGNTFAWEDDNRHTATDRDYNDFVLQVRGATASAPSYSSQANSNRNWLNTDAGKELIAYANRPTFESGSFVVNPTGKVKVDFIFDGGWNQGELGVFSLEGMQNLTPGSAEFIKEAARRALTNSDRGRVLINDRTEGAKFSSTLSWEKNFNAGTYQGVDTFEMKPGDDLAFIMMSSGTIQEIYANPNLANTQPAKQPFFSISEANPDNFKQMVAVDNKGTFAFEDARIDQNKADKDYNDFVFQVTGLEGNVPNASDYIQSSRDWRTSSIGQDLLNYTQRPIYNTGTYKVGESGKMTFDFLYDGGWYQSELAVFSLKGMENLTAGSDAFIKEAARRALSNSKDGYVLLKNTTEGAKFNEKATWENNFNAGTYQGVKSFEMDAGDEFATLLVQTAKVQDLYNNTAKFKQQALFSVSEVHYGGKPIGQMVAVDNDGTYAFEDVRTDGTQSDRDYNDIIFQIKGAKGASESMDSLYDPSRNWRKTETGKELLTYANRSVFDEGVFTVGQSGQVKVDFLYDGGAYQNGQIGIFSLTGMDIYETGSKAFMEEALRRATSNTTEGFIVATDSTDAAKFSANLSWEPNYNGGQYRGSHVHQMNSGDTLGVVMVANDTLTNALNSTNLTTSKRPYFSMSAANSNNSIQMAEILNSVQRTIIGMEDVYRDNSNKDYNDFIISIEGVKSIDVTDLDGVISHNRQWQNTTVGQDIFNYFNNV
jgi:hypothetical protein